jgi:hypothetical protein
MSSARMCACRPYCLPALVSRCEMICKVTISDVSATFLFHTQFLSHVQFLFLNLAQFQFVYQDLFK